jgi:hypothetical protein
MDKISLISLNKKSIGDLVVDGVIFGLASGLVMVTYLVLVGMIGGEGLGEILGRFSPMGDANPATGLLAHLAVSAIYGLLFGMLSTPFKERLTRLVVGIGYGLALFFLARFALLPVTGSALENISPLNFAIAHMLYGVTLGIFVGK